MPTVRTMDLYRDNPKKKSFYKIYALINCIILRILNMRQINHKLVLLLYNVLFTLPCAYNIKDGLLQAIQAVLALSGLIVKTGRLGRIIQA